MKNEIRSSSTWKLFAEGQERLKQRIRSNMLRLVQLDPGGMLEKWLAVVVQHSTGIVYANQCAGVATDKRLVEGYLHMLGGPKYEVDSGRIRLASLTHVFHEGGDCKYTWQGRELPTERLAQLEELVGEIPYWLTRLDGDDTKQAIRLDLTRVDEIAEAWIPVETPEGPGVLVYRNCD